MSIQKRTIPGAGARSAPADAAGAVALAGAARGGVGAAAAGPTAAGGEYGDPKILCALCVLRWHRLDTPLARPTRSDNQVCKPRRLVPDCLFVCLLPLEQVARSRLYNQITK